MAHIEEILEVIKQLPFEERREIRKQIAQLDWRYELEELRRAYRARLSAEGKSVQSSDEVLKELKRIRETVADELYPE